MDRIKVSNRATPSCFDAVGKLLSEKNIQVMRDEYKLIDFLYKVTKHVVIQGPVLEWLSLLTDEVVPSSNSMTLRLGSRQVSFKASDFAMVTGLAFGPYDGDEDDDVATGLSEELKTIHGTNMKNFKRSFAEQALISKENDAIRKYAVVYIINHIVQNKQNSQPLWPTSFRLADNPADFNKYPWGRFIFEAMLKEWSGMILRANDPSIDPPVGLTIHVFPYALQGWLYEILPERLCKHVADKLEKKPLPRIMRWKSKRPDYGLCKIHIFEQEIVSIALHEHAE